MSHFPMKRPVKEVSRVILHSRVEVFVTGLSIYHCMCFSYNIVDATVLTRIEETFKRVSTATGYLPQNTFTRDILGDGVPTKLAEVHYIYIWSYA